ncbi:MAG: hypothetical protein ACOCXZ_02010 [Chloroflexota bacterium]
MRILFGLIRTLVLALKWAFVISYRLGVSLVRSVITQRKVRRVKVADVIGFEADTTLPDYSLPHVLDDDDEGTHGRG